MFKSNVAEGVRVQAGVGHQAHTSLQGCPWVAAALNLTLWAFSLSHSQRDGLTVASVDITVIKGFF